MRKHEKRRLYIHAKVLHCKIEKVFQCEANARRAGYTEPTHYIDGMYGILGKSIGINRMIFAAYKK